MVEAQCHAEDRRAARRAIEGLGGSVIDQRFTRDGSGYILIEAGVQVAELSSALRKVCRHSFTVEAIGGTAQDKSP